jgi:hypothetical protein
MNMIILTGLSVAFALSIMSTNNFYADRVTNTSIKDAHKQAEAYMTNVIAKLNSKKCEMPSIPGMPKPPGC